MAASVLPSSVQRTQPPVRARLVGSLASALQADLREGYGDDCPRVAVVEPTNAACFYHSVKAASGKPHFAASVVDLLDPWQCCRVWKRFPTWSYGIRDDAAIKDRVWGKNIETAGIPAGFTGAINFDRKQFDALISLLFTQMCFGWSVNDDVYVIPDHCEQLVALTHHEVAYVTFRKTDRLEKYVRDMAGHISRQ